MSEYLYGKKNPSFLNYFKGGYTTNPLNRIASGDTEHLYPSEYNLLLEVNRTENYKLGIKEYDRIIFDYGKKEESIDIIEHIYDIKLPLLKELSKFLVDKGGGTEFIKNEGFDLYKRVILEEFPILGLKTRDIPSDERDKINIECKEQRKNKYNNSINSLISMRKKKVKRDKQSVKDEIKWINRQYQEDIIKLGLKKMNEIGKFYLELATGGGKTYIVFKILKQLNPGIIFMMSPRLKINKQNISGKYKSIMGKEYSVFNLSEDKNLDEFMRKEGKKIIVGCTQCSNRFSDMIKDYDLQNIAMWFDECHWGIEGWIKNGMTEEQEYLLTSQNIKYKIFTSASPNTELVEENERIFGDIYKEISVKELIISKYLCGIVPFIFEVNDYNVDYCKTIVNDFKKYNRNWGLSFHTQCKNAFNMFYKHYLLYKNSDTDIKPFLLIGDNKEIKENDNYKEIDLGYKFEEFKEYEKAHESMAYVVKKCDMGYDFDKIDYISLTDKKMSYSDIIQCIGRGLRSDGLGVNGTNLKKELYLMIPTYMNEDNLNNYEDIINVIQYLQFDIGLDWENISFSSGSAGRTRNESNSDTYDGDNTLNTKILDVLKIKKINWTPKKLLIYCKNNHIHSTPEYYDYKERHPTYTLPVDIPSSLKWSDTYRKHIYYNKEDCITKLIEISGENPELDVEDDHGIILEKISELDSKIPNTRLSSFYGGNDNEFIIFN
jgi:hypothetical protein